MTQLRLPARGVVRDVIAMRTDAGIAVDASELAALGIAAPPSERPVLLSAIAGLSYQEAASEAAIVITCAAACYQTRRIDLENDERNEAVTIGRGVYLNYEANAQWTDADGASVAGIGEGALFGPWGLIITSALAETSDEETRFVRLESAWTIDRPRQGVRVRLGDSAALAAGGGPVRFGGFQIGRHFALTPSLITYPVPLLTGEAQGASTVQLYVDGVLRGQSRVEAGPFSIEHAPLISGAGEAELVVRDILGREQTITRPFFVSTTMLRKGLSDWSLSGGAERRDFGRDNSHYGDAFASGRYRYGLSDAVTVEGAADVTENGSTLEAGASFILAELGEAHISHARSEYGQATSASWYYVARAWSFGLQFDARDESFAPLGVRGDDNFRSGAAGNLSLNLGDYGALGFTAAAVEYAGEPTARTLTIGYQPEFAGGSLSFRLRHTQQEESELAAGVSFSLSLQGDASGHVSVDSDKRGVSYRASAQRAATHQRLGWRARASVGAIERLDLAALSRNSLGDSMAQFVSVNGDAGVRVRHAGSVGWIEGLPFAGRRIDGAFAVVDAGAPGVTVTRERMPLGVTGRDGRLLATNLRAYDENAIGISADELPLDRAIDSPFRRVTPAEGAGVVVRFEETQQVLEEARVLFADGSAPARGAILIRVRDSKRFPIGSEGRIVLQGTQQGDVLTLDGQLACTTHVDGGASLTLTCAAAA